MHQFGLIRIATLRSTSQHSRGVFFSILKYLGSQSLAREIRTVMMTVRLVPAVVNSRGTPAASLAVSLRESIPREPEREGQGRYKAEGDEI